MTTNHDNKHAKINPRLEKMLGEISDQRIAFAASGVGLVEKARLIAKRLEENDLERRAKALEKEVNDDLNEVAAEAVRSLYEE